MKSILGIFGLLLILSGVVWFFQGIGLLPGSFMTGQTFWAVAGFLAVISGIVLVRRWRRKAPASPNADAGTDSPKQES